MTTNSTAAAIRAIHTAMLGQIQLGHPVSTAQLLEWLSKLAAVLTQEGAGVPSKDEPKIYTDENGNRFPIFTEFPAPWWPRVAAQSEPRAAEGAGTGTLRKALSNLTLARDNIRRSGWRRVDQGAVYQIICDVLDAAAAAGDADDIALRYLRDHGYITRSEIETAAKAAANCEKCKPTAAAAVTAGGDAVAWYHKGYGPIELSRVHRPGWRPLYDHPAPSGSVTQRFWVYRHKATGEIDGDKMYTHEPSPAYVGWEIVQLAEITPPAAQAQDAGPKA